MRIAPHLALAATVHTSTSQNFGPSTALHTMADPSWQWDIEETVSYIRSGNHGVVALQFPDSLLGPAPSVAQLLQQRLGNACKVYVLADTAYNPLAVDEVAAQHIHASCVIHYGWASLTPVSQLPAFFVFPKSAVASTADIAKQLVSALASSGAIMERKAAVIAVDQAYQHVHQELAAAVQQAAQDHPDVSQTLVFCDLLPRSLRPAASSSQRSSAAPATQPVQPAAGTSGCCQGSSACSTSLQAPLAAACCPAPPVVTDGAGRQGQACCNAQTCSSAAAASGKLAPTAAAQSPACQTTGLSCQPESSSSTSGVAQSVAGGLRWQLPPGISDEDCAMVWFGSSSAPALQLLQLAYNAQPWLCCEPEPMPPDSSTEPGSTQRLQVSEGLAPGTQALLKRRYYLVERAKAASIVGILAGTLAAAGFRDAISLVRAAAHAADKKTYTFVMGKPNPAKLANFPEVEVWVMVADPLGFLMDSKEYLAPIITPHEAMLAFKGLSLQPGARYPLDFGEVLEAERRQAAEGAAAQGGAREEDAGEMALVQMGGLRLVDASKSSASSRQLAARDAAEYLALHRQYKGLETPLTGAAKLEAVPLVQGRAGRAAGYDDEPSKLC